jgi:hypothetical protein
VRWMDWRVSSGEDRCIKAEAGDWFAVPRRGRVEEAVGVALGAVRGAGGARARRRGMAENYRGDCRQGASGYGNKGGQYEGLRRRQTRAGRAGVFGAVAQV